MPERPARRLPSPGQTGADQLRKKLGTGQQHKILSYIGAHYTERLHVEDIAKAVSYSPGECCRIFKKELGITISQFLNAHRVERSTALLSGTDMSIAEIAYETGFGSTSYYIKHFKELTGMTPLQYRICPP